jgi:hypothetical protein
MSIGNLKTQGNKGTNFPFQLAVLQLLKQISAAIGGGGGPTVISPKALVATSNGLTPLNAKSISLYYSGTNGTFDGDVIPNGVTINYFPSSSNEIMAETAYTVPTSSGGFILITYTL